MCGIIAYVGPRDCASVVFSGLKQLEYRGYDSWGIALRTEEGAFLFRQVGKISEVAPDSILGNKGSLGIGHTRWATHGNVTQHNAHPHASNDGSIFVAHNGIVENFHELRTLLTNKGFQLLSETDTEVIPNLVQLTLQEGKSFPDAVRQALTMLEGSYAVVVFSANHEVLIGAVRGSPLAVGLGHKEYFMASDVTSFLEYTKRVVYVDDQELALLTREKALFLDVADGSPKTKLPTTIDWTVEQAQKGPHSHFMLKEIIEQESTIKTAVGQDAAELDQVTRCLQQAFGVFFVGCGTSYHACVSASYVFSKVAKKHVNVVIGSEFANYEDFLTQDTLLVAVSQSGETADILEAVRSARKHGAKVIAIANVMGSTLTRLADLTIYINAGPEICVLSTKSYTSQLAVLTLLAYAVAGKVEEGKSLLTNVAQAVPALITENVKKLKTLAKSLATQRDFFLIGRDLAYPTALEGALKIKEVSYIHAEGFPGAE
ncbi:MAG: glutamine--fructose-6-phosphate transaminase (isomerizing), partial [Acidobacteriota bacterium]